MKKAMVLLLVVLTTVITVVMVRRPQCELYSKYTDANQFRINLIATDNKVCGASVEFVNNGPEDINLSIAKASTSDGVLNNQDTEDFIISAGESAVIPVKEPPSEEIFYAYVMNQEANDKSVPIPFTIREYHE